MPGFRPGKVPLTILKQRYGAAVRGEILERAVNEASSQAMSERGVRPASQPKVDIVSADEGKDLEYDLELEVLPEISPMDFSTLELERVKITVSDEEVDNALERIASERKTSEPLDKPREAAEGDVLVLDFAGTVDGEAHPGMAGEDHHLELGSNSFIAGFEEQLIGAEAGDSKDVTVTFPKEYVNDALAGKEAVFACTIKEVRQTVPAKIDDELAKSMGEETLSALKDKVREQLSGEYDRMARERLKRQMLDKLADAHDFPTPASMLDGEFETIWNQVLADREKGVTDPDDEGKDDEELKAEYKTIAERRVRLGLLLSEVGRSNSIDVAQEEMNAAIMREAHRFPGQEKQVFEFFQSNPEAQARVRAPIFEDKVIDFIAELAKVNEREATLDTLMAEEAEGAEKDKAPKKKAAKKKAPAKKAAAGKDDDSEAKKESSGNKTKMDDE